MFFFLLCRAVYSPLALTPSTVHHHLDRTVLSVHVQSKTNPSEVLLLKDYQNITALHLLQHRSLPNTSSKTLNISQPQNAALTSATLNLLAEALQQNVQDKSVCLAQ